MANDGLPDKALCYFIVHEQYPKVLNRSFHKIPPCRNLMGSSPEIGINTEINAKEKDFRITIIAEKI